jgi:hypothetical protein
VRLTTVVVFGRCSLLLLLLAGMSKPGLGQGQTVGKWSTLSYTMPINPIHVALLYNGKILVVAGSGNCPSTLPGCPSGSPYGRANNSGALLLDPTNGNITQFSVSWDMFCNGMVVLPDGRAFINGGTLAYDPFQGSPKSSIFDPATNTFVDAQNMAHGRWYPTVLTLGDGRIMTFSGALETATGTNTTVEFYTLGSGWSQPSTAPFTPDLYPRLHLLPNGKVFYSGASPISELFDPSTTTWTLNVASTNYGSTRSYGSSVLLGLTPVNNYDPVVLIMGGNSPATATTETIDLGSSNPAWQLGPNMSQARIEMNAVILPNGKVLAIGGSVNDEDATTESLNADLYDPPTNTFSSGGANSFARLYHSVALLLPDATVWVAGGNPTRGTYEPHVEMYQPAYLFQSDGTLAARPSITSVPSSISYGNQFTVQTPDAASIASAVLIRNGTVTHAFGMDQRMVGMSFTTGSGSLTVTAPPNGNIAPPGYYMLFILNSNGVPSVASSVLLSNSSSAPAPTVTSILPNSGSSNGGTAVAITGTGFQAGARVSLGETAATGVTVVSSTSITATTPAHAAGTIDVVMTNSDTQSGMLTQGFTYTAVSNPAPMLTGISPSSGTAAGGTAVTITGTGFQAGATVSLGGTPATGVTVVSGTSITATTAAHGAGAVDVVVTNSDTQAGTLTQGFTYTTLSNPPPTVTSISPNSGTMNGGTAVAITGTGFQAGTTVSLGGTPATGVTVASSTSITATTPAHAAGAVDVVVSNAEQQSAALANGYTYTSITPGLGLSVPTGDSSSATVVAGQTASYTLSIGGASLSGTASLSCSGSPMGANCSVPVSEPFSSTVPATFNVSVTTTPRTEGALRLPAFAPVTGLWIFALLGMVVHPGRRIPKRSLRRFLPLTQLTLLLLLCSCGGGSSTGNPQPNPNGTPAGTYTLNVKATSNATTQTTSLTLIVR